MLNLKEKWNKKYLLLIGAAILVALYFYGANLSKDNSYVKYLPILGGLAFGLHTVIQIAQ